MNFLKVLSVFVVVFALFAQVNALYQYNPITKKSHHVSFSEIHDKRVEQRQTQTSIHKPNSPINTQTLIQQQRLDHFNREDNRTFSQTYFINTQFVNKSNPNTPVFFLLGWEGGLSSSYIELGSFVIADYAQQYQGLLIAVEHRFYGSSIPSIPGETYTQLLPYLTSEQALADYASYVDMINQQYGVSGPWIVLSGSYGGNLAAWAKLKYPHLFDFSFSISAPVQAQVNYEGYFEVVGNVLQQANCSAQITQATNEIASLLGNQASGWAKLQKDFNLCGPITDIRDGAVLISVFANQFASTVQYATGDQVPQLCQSTFTSNDPYSDIINSFFSSSMCNDVSFTTYLNSFQPIADELSWEWQTCNEFGYYQTGDGAGNPMTKYLSLDYYTDVCAYLWNVTDSGVDSNIAWTNVNYGGWNISTANTFFSNGGNDPWHVAGVLNGPAGTTGNYFAVTAGASHCQDMEPPSSDDSPALKQTRAMQTAALKTWLSTPSESRVSQF